MRTLLDVRDRRGLCDLRVLSMRALVGAAVLMAGVACADKAFTPPAHAAVNARMKLMVMATSAQQVAPSARYVWVGAAAIIPGGDTGLLAMMTVPATGGTQSITLDVDISRCLAATSAKGASGCSIIVGAALRPDSIAPNDTTDSDPFRRAFDYVLVGPFDVSTGRAPTIPPIDLSASRFSIFDFEQDNALRLGGAQNILFGGGSQGWTLAGAASGTGAPVLYSVTAGADLAGYVPTQGAPQPQVFPALAIFENGQWRRVLATGAPPINIGANTLQGFADVTALATNDVYVAATNGLYKFDGAVFTRITNVTDSLSSVSSTSAAGGKLVIAGAPGGVVWIGYGTTWQRYNTGSASRLDGVCITGPGEAFAASSVTGALYRFNGTSWTSVPTPVTGNKSELQCPVPGQAFIAVANAGFYRWTAGGWTQFSASAAGPVRAQRMAASSATEIYAAGDSALTDRGIYRNDGTSWSQVGRRRWAQSPMRMWADPRGGAAYVISAMGTLEKVTPSGVTLLSYQPSLRDVVMTSASSAFAVGWNLFLARWDGAGWKIDAPPAGTPSVRILQGVWSDGPSNAWAVGNLNTILRYNGTAWTVVSDENKPVTAKDSYNAVWGVGSDVWIAGETTIVHCKAVNSCAVEHSGGGILYSIWGSSASNVFAVGAGGRILRYNGTSWAAMNSPTSRNLARVAGSGANDVWAVGDSTLVHFDGTQWTSYPITDDLRSIVSRVPANQQATFQLGLWVKGPKEAYVGGDPGVIARWDGSGWRETARGQAFFGRRVLAITGAAGCAMALADGQSDIPASTMWRGIGTNGCMATPMGTPPTWP
ncbi:MAG: sialidase family protein [Gemmatimonadaceae bacterium]